MSAGPRPPKIIPPQVAAAVRDHFDRRLRFTFAGWPHGQSMMWRATDNAGPALYVKVHAKQYLYDRHLHAYRHWVPRLSCRTPAILWAQAEELLVVFAELPGAPLEIRGLPIENELRAYETAGQVARELHAIRCEETTTVDAGADAAERMERFTAAAGDSLSIEVRDWLSAIEPDTEVLSGESAVPCHRDFSPRNWLVDETSDGLGWSLIDFERARLDLRYADFKFMWPNHWKGRPERRSAFFAGYGRELSADEETRLRFTVLINCLGTISWARENNDPAFGRWALETIEDLYEVW